MLPFSWNLILVKHSICCRLFRFIQGLDLQRKGPDRHRPDPISQTWGGAWRSRQSGRGNKVGQVAKSLVVSIPVEAQSGGPKSFRILSRGKRAVVDQD